MELEEFIQIARGNKAADLILKNANVVDVLTGEINSTDVVIADEKIVALSKAVSYTHLTLPTKRIV